MGEREGEGRGREERCPKLVLIHHFLFDVQVAQRGDVNVRM